MAYRLVTNCSAADGIAKLLKEQREAGEKTGVLNIRLPIPDQCLSPNARSHWAVKARAAKKMRLSAQAVGLAQGPAFVNPIIDVKLYRKYKRKSDRDNLIASLKSAIDGLADAKLFANDDQVHWGDVAFYVDKDDPRCMLIIREKT